MHGRVSAGAKEPIVSNPGDDGPVPEDGRPVLLRGGTVLTMDDSHTILDGGEVLVVGDRIAAVGHDLETPEGTQVVDATGGVVMPGMIDTHRHMWQTSMRGYGADWTLTQYFVSDYLEHGKAFRPEDVRAGNVLSAWESLEAGDPTTVGPPHGLPRGGESAAAGVTAAVDWSHGMESVGHADATVAALDAVPGRFVLAYGNI